MMIPQPAAVYLIPGMFVGCFMSDALLATNLQCLYSEQCINEMAKWISNLPSDAWPKPLNHSLNFQFLVDNTIRYIIDKKMIDRWVISKNFSSYYSTCAPIECSYKILQRNTFIDIIGILLGLYGGLTVALRFIAPKLVQIFTSLYARCFRSRKTVEQTLPVSRGNRLNSN